MIKKEKIKEYEVSAIANDGTERDLLVPNIIQAEARKADYETLGYKNIKITPIYEKEKEKIKEYEVSAIANDGTERDLLVPNIIQAEARKADYETLGYKNIKITPIYEKEKEKIKTKRKKFLGIFEKGSKIKSHIYKRGTKIDMNKLSVEQLNADYPYKNASWVWDNWTEEQREHFLRDHKFTDDDLSWATKTKYDKLYSKSGIQTKLKEHINKGRYEHGTKIEKFEPLTFDEWWEENKFNDPETGELPEIGYKKYLKKFNASESKSHTYKYEHLIDKLKTDSSISKINLKPYGVELIPYNANENAYIPPIKLTSFELLSLYIKQEKNNGHTNEEILLSIENEIKYLLENKI